MNANGIELMAEAWPAYAVGLILIYSGGVKLVAGPRGLRATLLAVPYLPARLSMPLAALLPVVEVGLGFGLLFGFFVAKVATVLLLAAFSGASILIIGRKLKISCNCFGGGDGRLISWPTVRLNLALVVMVATSLPLSGRPASFGDIFASATMVGLYLCVAQLLDNKRQIRRLQRLNILWGGAR